MLILKMILKNKIKKKILFHLKKTFKTEIINLL